MSKISLTNPNIAKTALLVAAVGFLYAAVLGKLGLDWWTDENYSHGLLVPFVIGFIVWSEWDTLKRHVASGSFLIGGVVVAFAILMLFAGTLGAELFTTRISLVSMIAGIVICFFGVRILHLLAVPFALLLLAIPIPQILFNRIAFPLQIWASQMAVWGIRFFDVPTLRKGNVIDILPSGATQIISLEVVEACSGIRSLMTLVTLALILGYFTRRDGARGFANLSTADLFRTVVLMLAAVPIAVLTNAARVTTTGILTYYYGKQAVEGPWHDASGWLVYVVAIALLIGANLFLGKLQSRGAETQSQNSAFSIHHSSFIIPSVWPLIAALLIGGIAVNWFTTRGEAQPSRQPLAGLSTTLGDWRQHGDEVKFSEQTESVLRTTDYTMREYLSPEGRGANIYIGYYASQRTGATYHSPQNCLPGAGWVMRDPQYIDIARPDGTTFRANRYIIENGPNRHVMIYWYQGRGRIEASEYTDKINTVWDSITRRRTDGAMVRIMTGIAGPDESAAVKSATDLAAHTAQNLSPFVPD